MRDHLVAVEALVLGSDARGRHAGGRCEQVDGPREGPV
jgi:hypothetical protein